MTKEKLIQPYRTILMVVLTFLLVKSIVLALLLADISGVADAIVHGVLIYLLIKNHRFLGTALWVWATLYLFVYTGIKAGAKTLIILRGDSWEIDMPRYYLDLFLVALGVVILLFGDKMFQAIDRNG